MVGISPRLGVLGDQVLTQSVGGEEHRFAAAAGHSAPPDWTVAGAEAVGAADVAETTTPDTTSTRAPDRTAGRKLDRKLDRNTRISST